MELRFFDDPAAFLAVAGEHLAEQPVVGTVVAGVAERAASDRRAGIPWPAGVPCWFAALVDGGRVVSSAMRTARFGAYPAFLLPMSDDAAVLLARTLVDRDEPVLGANGALPAVEVFCGEMAAATDRRVVVGQHTRLFELEELVEPRPVAGRLREARPDEQDIVTGWYDAFMRDADEQAGRAPGTSPHETPSPQDLRHRIETGRVFVWEDPSGTPVHVTAASAPSYGVCRIGPVYTPSEHRRHGYAGAAVAEVSRRILAGGDRACLFTDQANPTSNKIYEALGYRRVVDMANLRVE
jgi:hypothetical protein